MDQKIRDRGSMISAFMLAGCSVITFVLGVPMVSTYPEGIWWAGGLLLISGIFLAISAFNTYRAAKREKERAQELLNLIQAHTQASEGNKNKIEILANWAYSTSEWKEFLKWEKKKTGSNTFIESGTLIILATVAIHYFKEVDWLTSFIISFLFGVAYGFLKYYLNLFSITLDENKMPEVIITNETVIINGHLNRFYGNNIWLGKINVNDAGNFNVLEITYCWNTRNGKTQNEITVPIPKGSLKEAIFLQEKLETEKVLH